SGRISSASSSPPRLRPTVSAAPTAPSRLSTGVPSSSDSSSTGRQRGGRPSISASSGDSSTSARPVNNQWARTLASTNSANGCGETTHCSSEPSSKSLRNSPSSDSSTASSAASHRSEEHTSELQSRENLVCRLLLEQHKNKNH